MVGTQKERGGEMEVEIIKAKGAGEDTSTGRKIDRLRVAAYCRVSTDDEDQIKSYNSMVRYYTDLIKSNKQWVFAGVFADKAITGTKTDKREEFQLLIQECLSGNIDLVIAKSIPRFARNTLDTLKYVRMLRERNIAVYFEVEKINTLKDGEFLLTILSSVAQQEVENTSAYVKKGLKMKMKRGELVGFQGCLGYDYDVVTKSLSINEEGAETVRYIFDRYVAGAGSTMIARELNEQGISTIKGNPWTSSSVMGIINNEKYKGDALLQKSYTVDFLTKKRTQNKGEIQMFYVEDDHDAIISKRIWECVQLEIKRRKKYLEEYETNSYSHRPESNPFASKIICGDCNKVFARKGWRSSTGVDRKVWQCSERYKVKGVMGCANRHVEEKTLIKAYLMAWNVLVENREDFMERWKEQMQSENLLEGYRAEKFIEYTDGVQPLTEMDTDFMLKTLDYIKVFENGTLLVVFLDGTEIECRSEKE